MVNPDRPSADDQHVGGFQALDRRRILSRLLDPFLLFISDSDLYRRVISTVRSRAGRVSQ